MARLEGSFPLKFNDRVIGKAYIVGQDETGLILDFRPDSSEILESIIELINHNQLPMMSFGFIAEAKSSGFIFDEPPEPKGLMQVMPHSPVHWEKMKVENSDTSREENAKAVRDYIQARYARPDKD